MACTSIPFEGYIAWNYLDLGPLGVEKELEGVDLVIQGEAVLTIGYNQANMALATEDYTVTGDTVPGLGFLPFPLTAPSFQVRLRFPGSQTWKWFAANIYKTGEREA